MESKTHFKMYKAKKQWLLAGITALGVLFGSTMMAQADTNTVTVANSTNDQVAATTVASASTNSQMVANSNSSSTDVNAGATLQTKSVNITPVSSTEVQASKQATTITKRVTSAAPTETYENGHWYLKDSDGNKLSGWRNLSGNREAYYNPSTYQMEYGERYIGNHWYYFNKVDGDVATGWIKLPDGREVYYDVKKGTNSVSGQGMLHGMQTLPNTNKAYYFDPITGAEKTGLQTINGKTYDFSPARVEDSEAYANNSWRYFNQDGTMATGFVQLRDGRTVYYNGKGEMLYGENYINGHWYFFNKVTGKMASGWTTLPDGRKVYYDLKADGSGQGMLHGAQLMDDHLYNFDNITGALKGEAKSTVYFNPATKQLLYFNENGELTKDTTIKLGDQTFKVSVNGRLQLTNGENYINGNWYLYDAKSGQVKTGWQKISDSRTVYYDPTTAVMKHGEAYINGAWYDFDTNTGAMKTGFVTLPDGRYVYYQTNGQMKHGEMYLNGYWYHFNESTGTMSKGFTKLTDGRLVYYDNQGHMIYGWKNFGGKEYYFNLSTGDAARGDVWIGGKEYFFDSGTGAQITDSYTIRLISWFYHRVGKITYSMYGSRDGADGTADCSGSVTRAIYEASGVPYSYLYNTESLHGYLIQNGYHLVHENSGYENDHRLGDVIIWGRKGYSAGEFGHTGIMTGSGSDAKMISTCYYTDGQKNTAVQNLNYNYYWNYDERPYYYVYRK